MRKAIVLMIMAFCGFGAVYAQEAAASGEAEPAKEKRGFAWPSFMTTENADLSTGFRRQRLVEVGLINTEIGLSNSWFGAGEFVSFVGDLGSDVSVSDFLGRGDFALEVGLLTTPLNVRFNLLGIVTLDLSVNGEVNASFKTSEQTLKSLQSLQDMGDAAAKATNLTEAQAALAGFDELKGEMYAAASAFSAVTIGAEKKFLGNKLWVRGAPSVYIPFLYMPSSETSMEAETNDRWKELHGSSSASAWVWKSGDVAPGLDLAIESRYAIWPVLDAGVSIQNIPIVPASMKNKQSADMEVNFKIPNPSSITDDNFEGMSDMELDLDYSFGSSSDDKKTVLRPTRFDFYALVKPFSSKFLIIRPDLGFSVNTLTAGSSATFNWGLLAEVNILVFTIDVGTKLFEDVWTQYLTATFNLGFTDIIIGAKLRGPTFGSSWTGKGFGAFFGTRFGL